MPESERKTDPEAREAGEREEVDESSEESFPASDPPSWAMGKRAEPKPVPRRDRGVDEPARRDREAGSKVPRP